jgi:hypothetical protein
MPKKATAHIKGTSDDQNFYRLAIPNC